VRADILVTVLGCAVLRWAARDRGVAATLLMSCLVLVAYLPQSFRAELRPATTWQ